MSLLFPFVSVAGGFVVLVWSAGRFVTGAATVARHFGMPPLLIGMLVVGFGTSAPEMLVSALAAWGDAPGIALGNAYGSNIANIALILGITAAISPVAVHSNVLRRELPILIAATALSIVLLFDLEFSRLDALILLAAFAGVIAWSLRQSRLGSEDSLAVQTEAEGAARNLSLRGAVIWTALGLTLLVVSSRFVVWGAVQTAQTLGISDLVIGLTIVAIGTSLPELASSLAAIRKGEHDIALGNVIGSNLFNTLAVVGIAGAIRAFPVPPEILYRDLPIMTVLTLLLALACTNFYRQGRVNRVEGAALVAAFAGYTGYLATTAAG
jgi:cation:H+ antiporter